MLKKVISQAKQVQRKKPLKALGISPGSPPQAKSPVE